MIPELGPLNAYLAELAADYEARTGLPISYTSTNRRPGWSQQVADVLASPGAEGAPDAIVTTTDTMGTAVLSNAVMVRKVQGAGPG